MKQVLILKEKHGEWHLDISTPKKRDHVALSILTARFGPKGEYHEFIHEGDVPAVPNVGMTEEQVMALPSGPVRQAGIEAFEGYRRKLKQWDKAKAQRERIERAIKEKDGRLAMRILQDRSDYEYEGLMIETLYDEYPQPE